MKRFTGFLTALFIINLLLTASVQARSNATPWTSEQTYQNLVYGASSTADVIQIMGYPDEVVKQEQIFPVIENFYYYGDGGTGEATVVIFQNNLLAGLLYKTASSQYMDLTYMLPNNGDMALNSPILAKFRSYYPNLPMFMFW